MIIEIATAWLNICRKKSNKKQKAAEQLNIKLLCSLYTLEWISYKYFATL